MSEQVGKSNSGGRRDPVYVDVPSEKPKKAKPAGRIEHLREGETRHLYQRSDVGVLADGRVCIARSAVLTKWTDTLEFRAVKVEGLEHGVKVMLPHNLTLKRLKGVASDVVVVEVEKRRAFRIGPAKSIGSRRGVEGG